MIVIKIKPLSINDAWKGRRFRTDKYKKYCLDVSFLLPPLKLPEPPYEIYFEFGFSSKGSDIDNPVKTITDILSKVYAFNDNLIYRAVIEKKIVPKGKEYIRFEIKHYGTL